jgi:hypothetical protein
MFLGFSLLPDTRVRACLRQVIRHCRKGDDTIAWLANAAWPVGSPTTIRRTTSDQANLPWTGIEYFLAAHCQEVGLEAEASALLLYALSVKLPEHIDRFLEPVERHWRPGIGDVFEAGEIGAGAVERDADDQRARGSSGRVQLSGSSCWKLTARVGTTVEIACL